jgi:hypothetical protein
MATKTHVILVGRNIARLVEISAKLDPMEYGHVIAQSFFPLEYLMGSFRTRPELAIVDLTGTESVVEYQEVLEQNPATCFVFLVETMPPSAAIARVTGRHGVFLDRNESALSISATGISLLHQRSRNLEQT